MSLFLWYMYYIYTTNNKQYPPAKSLFIFNTDLPDVLYHAEQHFNSYTWLYYFKACFTYLWCVVSAGNVIFEKLNTLSSVKILSKPHARGGGAAFHALNLEKIELQVHNFALSLDSLPLFLYYTHALIFI